MMDKYGVNYDNLAALIHSRGWKWYTAPFDLNIIGIRSAEKQANRFDDLIVIAYMDGLGCKRVYCAEATTDPGLYWLYNPMNVEGCAILKPGNYRACWQYGKHNGAYDALVQIGNMTVWRDGNKDSILDKGPEDTGLFGINLHRSAFDPVAVNVNRWSAGCQVVQARTKFDDIMELCRQQMAHGHGNRFSYTLIEEAEL
jgi:hypothetical protein